MVYGNWRKIRLSSKKPLLRIFWPRPSNSDNNPVTSFRSRFKEVVKTRRKRGNDEEKLNKLLDLRKEIVAGRQILLKMTAREIFNLEKIDISMVELKQRLWS